MKRFENQRYLIISMLCVTLLLIIQAVVYLRGNNTKKEPVQISIVAYGTDAERWEKLKEGAELACEKLDAEISVVTMTSAKDFTEQCDLIEREISNGADGLIIAACDSQGINDFLKNNNVKVPIVYAESGGGEESVYELVSANNYDLGQALAQQVIDNEKDWVKIAIVLDDARRDSVTQRMQGVYDSLLPFTDNIVTWDRKEAEFDMIARKYLQRWLVEEAVDVVITLDSESTDALMDAMDNLNKKRKVYSIATSDKGVYYLDHERIKALNYQDEFGIGYLSASKILSQMGEKMPEANNRTIASRIVLKSDIYEGDNEKILFPFVK